MSKKTITSQEVLFFTGGLFLINPLICILFSFNILFSNIKVNKSKLVNLFIIVLAFFLAFINSTKIPENDLLFHANQYLYAKNYSLLEYLKYIEKEPLGYVFNYVMYYISGGSVKFWVITFSFSSYMLFFYALKKFYMKLKAPVYLLVLSLILAAFFPQLFSLSAHLIRQFIASSIFIYFAVDKIFYNNNKWWLALIGILTHGSSLILYALVYFKFLGNFKKHKALNSVLLILLVFYQIIAKFLLTVIGGVSPAIDYILLRASDDTTFNSGDFQLMNFIMMIVMIAVALTSKTIIGNMFDKNRVDLLKNEEELVDFKKDRTELEKNVKFFFITMIILSFFIVINLKQSELSNRLFFYLFFYFPFVIPLFFMRFKQRVLLSYFASLAFLIYFTYRLEFGTWTYASLYKLSTNTFFEFLNDPELPMESKKYYW